MRKLTKTIENNVLKIHFQCSNSFFVIENNHSTKSNVFASKFIPKNFLKEIKFLDISKLKYPTSINIFRNSKSLINYTKSINNKNLIFVKINYYMFQTADYFFAKSNSPYLIFGEIKKIISRLIVLFKNIFIK
jgi:hypothetical protein